mgnify:CR=1 FL=1
MTEQQFFPFYEKPKPFDFEIVEIEADQKQTKEAVSTLAEILYRRMKNSG